VVGKTRSSSGRLLAQSRLAFRLIREPAVPLLAKSVPALAAVVPDLAARFSARPLARPRSTRRSGVVLAALELFLRFCPDAPAAFHRAALAAGRRYSPMPAQSVVIDAEFRRE
jgi:hypothetical protein